MKGKIAIVTGSTQGLGETISRRLIKEGLSGLVICGRNSEKGLKVESELNNFGCKTVYVKADLSKVEDCKKIIQTAKDVFGKVHYLVNSAGTTDRGTILNTTPELYDKIFNINTKAPFFLIQGAAQLMLDNNIEGSIVNIITMSSHGGQPFLTAYSASKGALGVITKNAAFSLMKKKIRVNGINIGWMNSPGEDNIQKSFHGAPDNWLESAAKGQPIGRLISMEEVAEFTQFLLSEKSGLITGSLIDFDQSIVGTYIDYPQPPEDLSIYN